MTGKLVTIPFHGQNIQTVQIDGKPHVALKPLTESIGLGYSSQTQKLKGRSWATVTQSVTVGADGKNREMTFIDLRTLTMWLATINENRVSEEARPLVVAYQNEVADVVNNYWTNGGAVNPRADEHQLNALMFQARAQMELCQAAKGLIHPDHLEAKARIVLARGLGEVPELDPSTRPLYTADSLKAKNLSTKKLKSVSGVFGKRMKAAYTLERGRAPEKYDLTLANGQVRQVNGYTEADRALMQQVWDQYFAEVSA